MFFEVYTALFSSLVTFPTNLFFFYIFNVSVFNVCLERILQSSLFLCFTNPEIELDLIHMLLAQGNSGSRQFLYRFMCGFWIIFTGVNFKTTHSIQERERERVVRTGKVGREP